MELTIISAQGHPQELLTLTSGRADALMMDDVLLAAQRAKTDNPDQWVITGHPLSYEVYACMFRKGDTQLKLLINNVIDHMETSGKLTAIYKQWFMKPIPPDGRVIGFPMSKTMKVLFAHPNDSLHPQAFVNKYTSP